MAFAAVVEDVDIKSELDRLAFRLITEPKNLSELKELVVQVSHGLDADKVTYVLSSAVSQKVSYGGTSGILLMAKKLCRYLASLTLIDLGNSPYEKNKRLIEIERCLLLHDTGKIAPEIPAELLNGGELVDEQLAIIRPHTHYGMEILSAIEGFKEAGEVAVAHHERFDGRGYPLGLSGSMIHPVCQIITLLDCYHAGREHRSYSPAKPHKVVREEILEDAGKRFDPRFARAFVQFIDQYSGRQDIYGDEV